MTFTQVVSKSSAASSSMSSKLSYFANYKTKERVLKGRCDICNGKDEFPCNYQFNLQECSTCKVFVHEKCYGMPMTETKNPNWECMACAYNSKDRVTECVLCSVNDGIHAMHPVYEENVDMPLMLSPTTEERLFARSAWVHSLCALYVADNSITRGAVYPVTKSTPSSSERFTHHFCFDGNDRVIDESRTLRCAICKKVDSENNTLGIPVQCRAGDDMTHESLRNHHIHATAPCAVAFHVGCARWIIDANSPCNRLFYVPESDEKILGAYCSQHAKFHRKKDRDKKEKTSSQEAPEKDRIKQGDMANKRVFITKVAPSQLEDEQEREHSLKKGDRVYACWRNNDEQKGRWYPGIIKGCNRRKNSYHIKFDDGDDDDDLAGNFVMPHYVYCRAIAEQARIDQNTVVLRMRRNEDTMAFNRWVQQQDRFYKLEKGDRVYACWLGDDEMKGVWYSGIITGCSGKKKSYHVKYDDGFESMELSESFVMPFDRYDVSLQKFRQENSSPANISDKKLSGVKNNKGKRHGNDVNKSRTKKVRPAETSSMKKRKEVTRPADHSISLSKCGSAKQTVVSPTERVTVSSEVIHKLPAERKETSQPENDDTMLFTDRKSSDGITVEKKGSGNDIDKSSTKKVRSGETSSSKLTESLPTESKNTSQSAGETSSSKLTDKLPTERKKATQPVDDSINLLKFDPKNCIQEPKGCTEDLIDDHEENVWAGVSPTEIVACSSGGTEKVSLKRMQTTQSVANHTIELSTFYPNHRELQPKSRRKDIIDSRYEWEIRCRMQQRDKESIWTGVSLTERELVECCDTDTLGGISLGKELRCLAIMALYCQEVPERSFALAVLHQTSQKCLQNRQFSSCKDLSTISIIANFLSGGGLELLNTWLIESKKSLLADFRNLPLQCNIDQFITPLSLLLLPLLELLKDAPFDFKLVTKTKINKSIRGLEKIAECLTTSSKTTATFLVNLTSALKNLMEKWNGCSQLSNENGSSEPNSFAPLIVEMTKQYDILRECEAQKKYAPWKTQRTPSHQPSIYNNNENSHAERLKKDKLKLAEEEQIKVQETKKKIQETRKKVIEAKKQYLKKDEPKSPKSAPRARQSDFPRSNSFGNLVQHRGMAVLRTLPPVRTVTRE